MSEEAITLRHEGDWHYWSQSYLLASGWMRIERLGGEKSCVSALDSGLWTQAQVL